MDLRQDVRACLLQVIAEQVPRNPHTSNMQSRSVLSVASDRLGGSREHSVQEAILTTFHDLFRTGYLAWGFNISNPDPPFFHITDQGRRSLAQLSRDPSNPDGYLGYLSSVASIGPIAASYISEALGCYVQDLPKATAVMVGAAAESMARDLAAVLNDRLVALNQAVPNELSDWRAKVVLDCIRKLLDAKSRLMPRELSTSFDAYWPAFVQQIRSVRNEAGHPSNLDPVTIDTIHGSLLIFPELAKLTAQLSQWVSTGYK